MKTNRAQEILNSLEKIDVDYKNTSVWIESVDNASGTAYVKEIGGKKSMEVNTEDLVEVGMKMK